MSSRLLPTWGLSVRLPQKVGVGLARRMSLTGDYLSAPDALRAVIGEQDAPDETTAQAPEPETEEDEYAALAEKYGVTFDDDEEYVDD